MDVGRPAAVYRKKYQLGTSQGHLVAPLRRRSFDIGGESGKVDRYTVFTSPVLRQKA